MELCVMMLHCENNWNGVVNVPRNWGVHIFLFKHDKVVDCDVDNQSDSMYGQGVSVCFHVQTADMVMCNRPHVWMWLLISISIHESNTCGSYPVLLLFTYMMLLLSSETILSLLMIYACFINPPLSQIIVFFYVSIKRETHFVVLMSLKLKLVSYRLFLCVIYRWFRSE